MRMKSLLFIAVLLLCGCKQQGWVTLESDGGSSQTQLSYDTSSIRHLPNDIAIVNGQWTNSSQSVVQTAVIRFECNRRTFRLTSMMTRRNPNDPLMPEMRNRESDMDVIPNGGWEEIMNAVCG